MLRCEQLPFPDPCRKVSLDIVKLSWLTVKECKRMRAATQHAIEQSMNQITGVCIQTHYTNYHMHTWNECRWEGQRHAPAVGSHDRGIGDNGYNVVYINAAQVPGNWYQLSSYLGVAEGYLMLFVRTTMVSIVFPSCSLAQHVIRVPFMVRWLAERSKAGKESLYSLGVGEAEKLRNEIRELQENRGTGSKGTQETQDGQGIKRAISSV